MMPYYNILLLLLVLAAPTSHKLSHATTGITRSTVVVKRGANDNSLTASMDASIFSVADLATEQEQSICSYDGILSFSHTMSLKSDDRFFATGQLQMHAIKMMVDEINTARCGVLVEGKRYAIELTTYGDDSSKEKIEAIVKNGMIPANSSDAAANFWLGPYTSGLTAAMSKYANETNTILVAGGAAATSVFKGYPTIFGTFPPTAKYLAQAVEALAKAGAKTAASIWEDASFTRGVCAALPSLAEEHGLVVQSQTEVTSGPTADDLDPVARNLSMADADPDVVVLCTYDKGCAEWIASMRRANWSPRAQVFTVCIGMDSFVEAVGTHDAMYMTGISPWDPSLMLRDAMVGWSAGDFAELFLATTLRTSTYHAASAAASVGTLVQAIEKANSFDSDKVASVLATEVFQTLYGNVAFDDNGQSKAPSLFLQYVSKTTVQTVFPLEFSSGNLVYPMPTWVQRDCLLLSTCETGLLGQCQEDGTCSCDDENAVSSGVGPEASCIIPPTEDYTYVSKSLLAVGLILFSAQTIFLVSCAAWTVYNRSSEVVETSQPIFLYVLCSGAFVMCLAILPNGIQGQYRYTVDPSNGKLTDESNPDIEKVDAACMAIPWLFFIGFSFLFSALFVKIWQIRMASRDSEYSATKKDGSTNSPIILGKECAVVRKSKPQQNLAIVVVVVVMNLAILLCWQMIDPLQWQRDVIVEDEKGYPTQSVGYCQSDNMLPFLIPLVVIDGLILLIALYLCFVTRKVTSDYKEGRWITASVLSMIQILVLALPILVITKDNNHAFYFVRALFISLMGWLPTALIFLPKMYYLKLRQAMAKEKKEELEAFKLGKSKFGDAVAFIDSQLEKDGLDPSEREQFHLVKQCLISHDDKRMYVPNSGGPQDKVSTRMTKFIMQEFAGVDIDEDESTNNKNVVPLEIYGSVASAESKRLGSISSTGSRKSYYTSIARVIPPGDVSVRYQCLPEFKELDTDQQRTLFKLLSFPKLRQWDYNIFDLHEVAQENALLFMSWAVLGSPHSQFAMAKQLEQHLGQTNVKLEQFEGYNFVDLDLKIEMGTLMEYIRVIQKEYVGNPYHNSVHAADVVQTLNSLIQMSDKGQFDNNELFSILLAAVVHDVAHPGLNNAFQVNSFSEFALSFNDASVLENYHASRACKLLVEGEHEDLEDNLNFLRHAGAAKFTEFRKRIMDAVLHTDMSKHFSTTDQIKTQAAGKPLSCLEPKLRWEVLRYMLHLADISNPAKHDPCFIRWADRCLEEFFAQGDMEKEMGLPVSLNCDRNKTKRPDSQIGFINFVVMPAFALFADGIIPAVGEKIIPVIQSNLEYWEGENEENKQEEV